MDQERIGKIIKGIRQDNNYTQKSLAEKLGVTPQAVSKWEQGKSIPDIGILQEISKEFNINLELLLTGKQEDRKRNNTYFLIGMIILGIILGVISFWLVFSNNNNFEFKTISSKCNDFKLTGSAAYNKEKAVIYISNIEFCGKEDNKKYKKISCTLYEIYKDSKTKITTCEKKEDLSLEEYLKQVNMKVDNYSTQCKNLTSNSLSLEIEAVNEDNQTIKYNVPIKLNDAC